MNLSKFSIVNVVVGVFFFVAKSVIGQKTENFYCGLEDCIIPLRLSCEEMIANYEFQGSCCSMESIPETRGCRLTVSSRGNCFWYPYCGQCDMSDEEIGCNKIYQTESDGLCPTSEYDPVGDSEMTRQNGTLPSCFPTTAPTFPPGEPTNPPLDSCPSLRFGMLSFVALFASSVAILLF
jgi:hypothetical protein